MHVFGIINTFAALTFQKAMRLHTSKYICLVIFLMLFEARGIVRAGIGDAHLPSAADSVVVAYLESIGIPLTQNTRVKLLKSGTDKFIDLFDAVRQARHHIHLEYFNFRNDSIAYALFDLLGEKAAEGVEVRMMFDAFGNMSNNQPLKDEHLEEIREKGIEVVKFDPIRFPYVNHILHRDHRKIVVIDGKVGYTGGMNVADYYIVGLPEIGAWRDMHVRIEGDAVNSLQDIFLSMWNKSTKQNIGGEAYYPLRTDSAAKGDIGIAITDRVPRKTPAIMRRMYVRSLNAAQDKVQIVNPYFVPTIGIRRAIKRALKRGIDVEIMIPGKSDVPFTPDAAFYFANKLRKRGAEIQVYNGGIHHSKIMKVDSL